MTLRTELGRALERVVEAKIVEDMIHIANGHVPNHEDYNKRCGKIAGMREVLAMAEEIERKALGEDMEKH